MLNSIKDTKNYIKENKPDWQIIKASNTYFTVKDSHGYMAYAQADAFENEDDPRKFHSISIHTVHKANKTTGTGYTMYKVTSCDLPELLARIKNALMASKIDIELGKEKNA